MLNAETFQEFLFSSCAYVQDEPLLVGVSGGVDSVVLCHLLHENKISFGIAHVNFGLRGKESDEDELFVADLAKQFNVSYYLQNCTQETFSATGENSIQIAARKIRYSFFETICKRVGFPKIAIAHHKDDSIETALLNFARGTGVKGLCGISPVNGNIIRPLLFATREEIISYAKGNNISWREDSSNETDKYSRNRFRHHLLPYLMSEIPQAYAGFDASFKRLEESEEIIIGAMELWKKTCCTIAENEIKISIDALTQFPKSEYFLLFFLRKNGFKEIQIDSVSNLLKGNSGTQLISSTQRLIRDRDYIFLIPKNGSEENNTENCFSFTEEIFTGAIPNEEWTAIVDSSSVQLPFTVRPWQGGDKMIPFGMNGHRNVSDILNDLKLPLHKKEKALVVLAGNEIVWIPGYRIAEKFRVNKNTSSIFKLIFKLENNGE
ncbi:MAG: tRNA lysidine(34) synthetase TilS [Bacteroidetes bacterium]|nr:tRNA lysidine(34) synthetase TilS [Bacteroidota bacterium]